MKRAILIGFCASVVLVFASSASAQVRYLPIDLGTLGGGFSDSSSANGVNNPARVVGTSSTTGGTFHGFLWTKKAGIQDLGTLGGDNSSAQGVNDAGQIVGGSQTIGDATSHAFLHTAAAGMQDLGTLGGSLSQANAINLDELTQAASQLAGWSFVSGDTATHAVTWDASQNILDLNTLGGTNSSAFGNNCLGQVVGSSDTTGGTTDAFVWDSVNGMQDLGTLGGSFAQASAINCNGQIAGFSTLTGDLQTDAFLYANGSMKDLGNPGGIFSQANAINDPGRVVGFFVTPDGSDTHAFLWTPKGGMQDLNNLIPADSGWDLNSATSITSRGLIVGNGTLNGNEFHAFLLVPVPVN